MHNDIQYTKYLILILPLPSPITYHIYHPHTHTLSLSLSLSLLVFSRQYLQAIFFLSLLLPSNTDSVVLLCIYTPTLHTVYSPIYIFSIKLHHRLLFLYFQCLYTAQCLTFFFFLFSFFFSPSALEVVGSYLFNVFYVAFCPLFFLFFFDIIFLFFFLGVVSILDILFCLTAIIKLYKVIFF